MKLPRERFVSSSGSEGANISDEFGTVRPKEEDWVDEDGILLDIENCTAKLVYKIP